MDAWPAPAKLNLFLHVVGRRSDGYHELQTLFVFLDRCDRVALGNRRDGRVRRTAGAAGVAEDDDLAVRAALRLKAETGCTRGADIAVEKRIPQGGGLGGGSSDAATVLRGLNAIWALDLPVADLARLGLDLGADVPVFVEGRAAFAEGVGERLQPVRMPECHFAVVTPDCHVDTASVFDAPALTRNTPQMTIGDFVRDEEGETPPLLDLDAVLSGAHNDCEAVTRRAHRQVDAALVWLGRHGQPRMTGTGASCFVVARSAAQARTALEALPEGWRGFAARGLDRSPLLARLEAAAGQGTTGV